MNHDYKYENMSEEDRCALIPAIRPADPALRAAELRELETIRRFLGYPPEPEQTIEDEEVLRGGAISSSDEDYGNKSRGNGYER
jgi:hypothetical protein